MVAKVDKLEREYGKFQEEHTKLKEETRTLHNLLENIDNCA